MARPAPLLVLCRPGSEVARREPDPERLLHLSSTELAFTAEETREYLAGALAGRAVDALVNAVQRSTAGWPALVALWATVLAGAEEPELEVERLAAHKAGLGALVESLLGALGRDELGAVYQLGHLPLLSSSMVAEVSGSPDLYARLKAAGVPTVEQGRQWERLGDPVADYFAGQGPLSSPVAHRAARFYERSGEDAAAVSTMLSGGLTGEAGQLIAGLTPARRAAIGAAALNSYIAELPEAVLTRRPAVWLQLARALDADGRWADRAGALSAARAALAGLPDGTRRGRLLNDVLSEQAFDHLREGRPSESAALARQVLSGLEDDQHAARSRVLTCLGRTEVLSARDEGSFRAATALLERAVASARRAGDDRWTAVVLLRLAEDALRERCLYAEALSAIDECLERFAVSTRLRAMALISRADTLVEMGRTDEAEAGLAEARRLGLVLRDDNVVAYVCWAEVSLSAVTGDAPGALTAAAECEARRGDWFSGFSGLGFLTDTAEALDRLGLHERAAGYLARARPRRAQDERQFQLAEAGLVARSGPAARGRELADAALDLPGLSSRRRWRLQLLRARAAAALNSPDAGPLCAAALDFCSELGWPNLPLVLEPQATAQVLGLASQAGSHAARLVALASRHLRVNCLGDLTIKRGNATVALPPGRPTAAVVAVVAADGRLHAEQLIELLWPGVALDAGRGRLRNVLSRVKSAAEGLLERQGEMVRLGAHVEVDLAFFVAAARAALELEHGQPDRAATEARVAVSLYRGPAFKDYPYEAWASAGRDQARALYLRLLDLLARQAEARQQYDEAVRLLEQGMAEEPYDEDRYLQAALILRSQGRAGSALDVARRCRAALETLGLRPSLPGWLGRDRLPL